MSVSKKVPLDFKEFNMSASPAAVKAAVPASAPAAAAEKPKKEKKVKAPKEPRVSALERTYPETAKIHVLSEKNPKRAGSKAHATFALYKNGMTVGDFLKAGGHFAALSWDVGHGFIKVA